MTRRYWDAVLTREYLEAELLAGRAPTEIAAQVGCALNTVRSYLIRHQLSLPAPARPTNAELSELYERLANIRAVAGELQVSYSTARDWLVAARVPLAAAARPRANFDIDHAARRYQDGEAFATIAKDLGIPTMTLRDRLVSEGRVVPRPRGRPKSAGPD